MRASKQLGKKLRSFKPQHAARSAKEDSDSSDDSAVFDTPRAPTTAEHVNSQVEKLQQHDAASAAKVCMDSLKDIRNDMELEERFRESIQMWKSSVPSATDCAVAVMINGERLATPKVMT